MHTLQFDLLTFWPSVVDRNEAHPDNEHELVLRERLFRYVLNLLFSFVSPAQHWTRLHFQRISLMCKKCFHLIVLWELKARKGLVIINLKVRNVLTGYKNAPRQTKGFNIDAIKDAVC